MSEVLSFKEFKKKYKYVRIEEMIVYMLYLLLKSRYFYITDDVMDKLLEGIL